MVASDLRAEVEILLLAVVCMRNASGHNCCNSSFIVDLAVGQIPRYTECFSSYQLFSVLCLSVKCHAYFDKMFKVSVDFCAHGFCQKIFLAINGIVLPKKLWSSPIYW